MKKSENTDPNSERRKADHINLAARARTEGDGDSRFYYEPMLSGHPDPDDDLSVEFADKRLRIPIWVSSMTGGTQYARKINHNLARACGEFGMGMGLGSCRMLLEDDAHLDDFAVRSLIGPDLPLYANLGIAQVEQLLAQNRTEAILELLRKLEADGLIVHVNPMQEWLQPEGDRIVAPPIKTIETLLERLEIKLIVKEVGQGMGPESIERLLAMPLVALEFAAFGGTNFATLELIRSQEEKRKTYGKLAHIGHSATEMAAYVNAIVRENRVPLRCRKLILSGGVKDFLDGYYLLNTVNLPAVYGQASGFLHPAAEGYEALQAYVESQIEGLKYARAFLRVR